MDTNLALVIATSVLAGVTGGYVYLTSKMVKETREQRYNAVLPVIDIELKESEPVSIRAEGVNDKEIERTIYSSGLRCVLHNIGIGPAIDIY